MKFSNVLVDLRLILCSLACTLTSVPTLVSNEMAHATALNTIAAHRPPADIPTRQSIIATPYPACLVCVTALNVPSCPGTDSVIGYPERIKTVIIDSHDGNCVHFNR